MADQSFFDKVASRAGHVPDVLSCIANLSNDEVFTPPEVVNKMLDLLPQELFANPDTTFLDPATKTGVFLREIAKRCLAAQLPGYAERSAEIAEKKTLEIPLDEYDLAFQKQLQEKIDHIFHKQLFGIGITELTSLLARRSVYCSKYPNGPYSITHFDDAEGNIRFRRTEHVWKDGKCIWCGANQKEYDRGDELESHAYEFIHLSKPEEVFNMKFDVVISNPPYQLSTGGGQAQAIPLYDKFVEAAIRLNPRYTVMIIPARWYAGGFPCIKTFRASITANNAIREIHDFPNASDCFTGVEIKGGVCYFLWERDYNGKCMFYNHSGNNIISKDERYLLEDGCETVIRDNEAIEILHKVQQLKESSFSDIVGTLWPFTTKSSFDTLIDIKQRDDDIFAYVMKNKGWIRKAEVGKSLDLVDKFKLLLPRSVGSADPKVDRVKPIIAEPNSCCSGTYIICGPFMSREYAENAKSYIETRFFHFLLSLKKVSQDTVKGCYEFIPLQDFSKSWTDEELYEKYGLSEDEISYIESSVWPDKE